MDSHMIVTLFEKETEGLGEHIARELNSVALRLQAAVPVGGGQHTLPKSVMGASHANK